MNRHGHVQQLAVLRVDMSKVVFESLRGPRLDRWMYHDNQLLGQTAQLHRHRTPVEPESGREPTASHQQDLQLMRGSVLI